MTFHVLLTLILGLLINTNEVFGYLAGHTDAAITLDSEYYGASCSPVKYTPNSKMQASISLKIEQLESNDKSTLNNLKIPVLIFRYTDLLNFTTIPTMEYFYDYTYYYKSGSSEEKKEFLKDIVNFKENKFVLDLSKGHKLYKDRIFNDYLTIDSKDKDHIEAVLPIYESGIYCTYIAPPIDADIKKLSIPVNYQNSYGYLPFIQYTIYTQYKYIVPIGLLLAGYLLHYILRFKVGKDFKNMNSISVISKAVIFYLLLPLTSLLIADWFISFIQNNYIPSGRHIAIFEFSKMLVNWVEYNFNILLRFFILLFAMGYGVIYYHKDNKNYREIPARLMNKAVILLVTDVGLFSLREIVDYFVSNIQSEMYGGVVSPQLQQANPHLNNTSIFIAQQVINFACGLFPLIWFVVSLIHYFKTKKTIAKFPPLSTTSDESIDANDRIIKSFRQSILIIFVLPVFLITVLFAFMIYYIVHSNIYKWDDFDPNGREDIAQLVLAMKMLEILTFDSSTVLPAVWVSVLNSYFTIVLLYAIWIRNDNGLVMDDRGNKYSSSELVDLASDND